MVPKARIRVRGVRDSDIPRGGGEAQRGAAPDHGLTLPRGAAYQNTFLCTCCWQQLPVNNYSLHNELAQVPKMVMLEPIGPSVVVFNAMLARVTIVEFPIPVNAGRANDHLPHTIIPGNQQKGDCVVRSL